MMYVEFTKNFFLPILANWWVLDSYRSPEPKNVWFLLSRHDVRRVHEKFLSRWFERTTKCQTHFRLLSPKTFDFYFLDMMYVGFMKNFFLPIRASYFGCFTHFGFLSPKTFDSYFIDIMYVKFMKKFFLADSSEQMGVRHISVSWAQKRLIPSF